MIHAKKLSNGKRCLVVDDDLNIYNAPDFKQALAKYIKQDNCHKIELDMSGVSDFDTACLQILLQAKPAFEQFGKTLQLSAPAAPVTELLKLYQLDGFFDSTENLPVDS